PSTCPGDRLDGHGEGPAWNPPLVHYPAAVGSTASAGPWFCDEADPVPQGSEVTCGEADQAAAADVISIDVDRLVTDSDRVRHTRLQQRIRCQNHPAVVGCVQAARKGRGRPGRDRRAR